MTKHIVRVVGVEDRVTIPSTDDEEAIQINLEGGTSIYAKPGSILPKPGETIIWEGGKIWIRGIECKKLGYAFETGKEFH